MKKRKWSSRRGLKSKKPKNKNNKVSNAGEKKPNEGSHYENRDIPQDYWEPLRFSEYVYDSVLQQPDGIYREVYCNEKCQVIVMNYNCYAPGMSSEIIGQSVYLSMKLNTREAWHDWRDFQRIKNELCGTLCYGIEVYPPQKLIVDTANQYHLFVLAPDSCLPFMLQQPPMVDYGPQWKSTIAQMISMYGYDEYLKMVSNARQREWHEYHKCEGLEPIGPVWKKRGWRMNGDGEAYYDEKFDKVKKINPFVSQNESSEPIR